MLRESEDVALGLAKPGAVGTWIGAEFDVALSGYDHVRPLSTGSLAASVPGRTRFVCCAPRRLGNMWVGDGGGRDGCGLGPAFGDPGWLWTNRVGRCSGLATSDEIALLPDLHKCITGGLLQNEVQQMLS
jgi:hypothetical protein